MANQIVAMATTKTIVPHMRVPRMRPSLLVIRLTAFLSLGFAMAMPIARMDPMNLTVHPRPATKDSTVVQAIISALTILSFVMGIRIVQMVLTKPTALAKAIVLVVPFLVTKVASACILMTFAMDT